MLRAMAWLPKLLTSGSNPEYPVMVNTLRALKDSRADFTLGIGYDDDVELAKSTLLAMLDGDSRVYKMPEPSVFVVELAASAVNINVRYWSKSSDFERLKSDLTATATSAPSRVSGQKKSRTRLRILDGYIGENHGAFVPVPYLFIAPEPRADPAIGSYVGAKSVVLDGLRRRDYGRFPILQS